MRLGIKITVGLLYCLHLSGTATSQVSDTSIPDSTVNDETKIFEDSMDVLNDFSLDSVDFGFDTSEFAFSQPDTAPKDERKMVAGPLFEFGIGNSDWNDSCCLPNALRSVSISSEPNSFCEVLEEF